MSVRIGPSSSGLKFSRLQFLPMALFDSDDFPRDDLGNTLFTQHIESRDIEYQEVVCNAILNVSNLV